MRQSIIQKSQVNLKRLPWFGVSQPGQQENISVDVGKIVGVST